MHQNSGNRGDLHCRPFNNGQLPFPNPPMFPPMMAHFPPRSSFRPRMWRGGPMRGYPQSRMQRPGFRPHHPGLCPPYMMNRPMFPLQERNGCSSARPEFTAQQNSENIPEPCEQSNESIQDSFQEEIFACDGCDRSFPSETAFDKHMSEHRVCGLEGCTFSAHFKIIEKHIEMQHSTGIFKRIGNLDSPESIAKWIEERKARFPSKENIEKRHKHQEELWKKGIRIGEKKEKLGRDKTRFARKDHQTIRKERENFFKKKQEKRDKVIKKLQPKLLIDDRSDWNEDLPPFRGIVELFGDVEEEKFKISDDEDDYNRAPTKIGDIVKVNSSLGALMAYGSDYSEEDDEVLNTNAEKNKKESAENQIPEKAAVSATEKKEDIKVDNKINSDDEGPLEVKIEKTTTVTENNEQEECSQNTRKKKRGNKSKDQKPSKKMKTQNVSQQFHTRKIHYLEKILDEDIRRERNIILQCVRHTIENNFYMNKK